LLLGPHITGLLVLFVSLVFSIEQPAIPLEEMQPPLP
jgi:hypothetical protein